MTIHYRVKPEPYVCFFKKTDEKLQYIYMDEDVQFIKNDRYQKKKKKL